MSSKAKNIEEEEMNKGNITDNSHVSNKKQKYITGYILLKDILYTVFHVDCELYAYPYDDLSNMDRGIRKMMWEGFDYNENPDAELITEKDKIFIIASNLGFYNVIIYLPTGEHPDLISVGPFRNEDATPAYFEQIIQTGNIPHSKLLEAENIFRELPKGEPDIIVSICKRILSEYFPGFENTEEKRLEFKSGNRTLQPDFSLIDDNFMEIANRYKENINNLFKAIQQGDISTARQYTYNTLQIMNFGKATSVLQARNIASTLNAIAFIALLYTPVNAARTMMLYIQMQLAIDHATDISRISYIPYDISHKYSLLVKNYGHASYHKKIRDIVDYIDLHLTEDLSLSALAERFGQNPTSLSAAFKKETDTNLTTYVKQARIREAIRLFNSTDQSVSDVALSVGYDDFAYFSRVFKEITGLSPRAYIKGNHAD